MIKPIVTDTTFLSRESDPIDIYSSELLNVIADLMETANNQIDRCAGLAANQVGYLYTVLVVKFGSEFIPIINPRVISTFGGLRAMRETCLSLPYAGAQIVRRHKGIKIEYIDKNMNLVRRKFRGFDARVIQHEMDHFEDKLICGGGNGEGQVARVVPLRGFQGSREKCDRSDTLRRDRPGQYSRGRQGEHRVLDGLLQEEQSL